MANRVGQQLGNYKLEKLLGEGGFAEVYLAEHIHLKHKKAIKVLRTILSAQEGVSFRTEAQRLAQLTHPHIIPVLDFDEREGFPYLVMEYAPNGSLRDRHPKGSRVSLSTIVVYVHQIASALQYIHNQKLIHRDVKPENMLLGPDNKVLLSDVGIAVIAHSEYSQRTQQATGTPYYMAPEQFRGKAEPASDQYSLGVVVYEWISGTLPFPEGDSLQLGFQHAYEPPPSLRSLVPTVSPDVEKVVMTALGKKPQERFTSLQAFATALEDASQTKPTTQPATQSSPIISSLQKEVQPQVATSSQQIIQREPLIMRRPKFDKDALYREGLVAKSKGDLERAASLWQQVLNRDKHFGNGILATQMEKLREEIRIQQINNLRQQAQNAQKTKAFEQEAEFWKELLRLSPDDKEASTCLKSCLLNQGREARNRGNWSLEINILIELKKYSSLTPGRLEGARGTLGGESMGTRRSQQKIDAVIQDAKNNQKFVWMYENAIQLVKEGNYEAAKLLLKDLWTHAPNYGDPAQLAKSLGIGVPSSSRFIY